MRYQRSRSSRHARKYHFFLAISSRNSVCFSATVYSGFFIFRNFKNQSMKFDWLSENAHWLSDTLSKPDWFFEKSISLSRPAQTALKLPIFHPLATFGCQHFSTQGIASLGAYSFALTFIVLCVIIQTRDKINGLGMLDIEETT